MRGVVNGTTNTVVNQKSYDAFGKLRYESNTAAAADVIFGYTGREFDEAIGLQYNRARYYNPDTGRFISSDPSGLAGGDANLYRYAGNNPLNASDPSGLMTRTLGGAYSSLGTSSSPFLVDMMHEGTLRSDDNLSSYSFGNRGYSPMDDFGSSSVTRGMLDEQEYGYRTFDYDRPWLDIKVTPSAQQIAYEWAESQYYAQLEEEQKQSEMIMQGMFTREWQFQERIRIETKNRVMMSGMAKTGMGLLSAPFTSGVGLLITADMTYASATEMFTGVPTSSFGSAAIHYALADYPTVASVADFGYGLSPAFFKPTSFGSALFESSASLSGATRVASFDTRVASIESHAFTSAISQPTFAASFINESSRVTQQYGINFFKDSGIRNVMRETAAGRTVLDAADAGRINLTFSRFDDVPKNLFGSSTRGIAGDVPEAIVFLKNTQNGQIYSQLGIRASGYEATAATGVHEGLHALGVAGSRRAEALVRLSELELLGVSPGRQAMRQVLTDMRQAVDPVSGMSYYGGLDWSIGKSALGVKF